MTGALVIKIVFLPQLKGLAKNHGLPLMDAYEKELIVAALPELHKNISNGKQCMAKKRGRFVVFKLQTAGLGGRMDELFYNICMVNAYLPVFRVS